MNVKTKRIKEGDKTIGYEITAGNGAVIRATAGKGGKFDCPALKMESVTLKSLKGAALWYSGPADEANEEPAPSAAAASAPEVQPTFDCLHPCAIIIQHMIVDNEPISMVVLQTLDCYGWLTPDRKPDYARAQRETEAHTQQEIARSRAMYDQGAIPS